MRNDLIEVICIIDESGSMYSAIEDYIGGFNAFVEKQRMVPKETRITVYGFNNSVRVIHENLDVRDDVFLSKENYTPQGSTALYDAICRAVDDVGKRLAGTPEELRPSKVIVAVLTDGMENASMEHTRIEAFDRVEHQQSKYNWEFVYLAANQDAMTVGTSLGFQTKDCYNFLANNSTSIRDAHTHTLCSYTTS